MAESVVAQLLRLRLEAHTAVIAKDLARKMPPGVGFALVMFDFGEGGSLAYCSNAKRADMVRGLEEMLTKLRSSGG